MVKKFETVNSDTGEVVTLEYDGRFGNRATRGLRLDGFGREVLAERPLTIPMRLPTLKDQVNNLLRLGRERKEQMEELYDSFYGEDDFHDYSDDLGEGLSPYEEPEFLGIEDPKKKQPKKASKSSPDDKVVSPSVTPPADPTPSGDGVSRSVDRSPEGN